jgi:hypothetical protein
LALDLQALVKVDTSDFWIHKWSDEERKYTLYGDRILVEKSWLRSSEYSFEDLEGITLGKCKPNYEEFNTNVREYIDYAMEEEKNCEIRFTFTKGHEVVLQDRIDLGLAVCIAKIKETYSSVKTLLFLDSEQ